MTVEKLPGHDARVVRAGSPVSGVTPDDLEAHMGKVFKYVVRRGLLIALFLHPFFKVLLLLYTYEATDHAEVDIPLAPRFLRVIFPARLRLAFNGSQMELSMRIFWRWIEKIYGRFLSRPASELSELGPLGLLGELLVGGRIVRLNLGSAPKRQIRVLIALVALVPILTALLGYLFFALSPFLLVGPRRIIWAVVRSVSVTVRTALRPVPALLAILVIMFATGDAWRMFAAAPAARLIPFGVLVMGLSLLAILLSMRIPDASWRAVIGPRGERDVLLRTWANRTPAAELVRRGVTPVLPVAGLESTEPSGTDDQDLRPVARNIRLVYLITGVIHVFAIAFWVSLTFVVVGFVVVSGKQTGDLLGGPASELFHLTLFHQEFVVTRQLIVLSVSLGCIAALTYSVGVLQSAEGRAAFIQYATVDLRRGIGALAYYLGMLLALLIALRDMGTFDGLGTAIKELFARLQDVLERLSDNSTAQ